jgi:hypothetical protein
LFLVRGFGCFICLIFFFFSLSYYVHSCGDEMDAGRC